MNIYIDFKKELGYQNAVNQYIELAQRSMCNEHKNILFDNEALKSFANEYKLHLSELHNEISTRISQNYIININAKFDIFLSNYISLPASPMKSATPYNKNKQNRLEWILDHIYNKKFPEEITILYFICDYYRCARNCIVHRNQAEYSSYLKSARSRFKSFQNHEMFKIIVDELNALNEPIKMNFDDQVLYSKASCLLAQKIFYESKYDLVAQARDEHDIIKKMVSVYHNNPKRLEAIIKMYFSRQYPIDRQSYDADWKIIISDFTN